MVRRRSRDVNGTDRTEARRAAVNLVLPEEGARVRIIGSNELVTARHWIEDESSHQHSSAVDSHEYAKGWGGVIERSSQRTSPLSAR